MALRQIRTQSRRCKGSVPVSWRNLAFSGTGMATTPRRIYSRKHSVSSRRNSRNQEVYSVGNSDYQARYPREILVSETSQTNCRVLSALETISKIYWDQRVKSLTVDEGDDNHLQDDTSWMLHAKNARFYESNNDSLITFHPFLDDDGIIRVRGRLRNVPVSYSRRYPVILPSNYYVTTLIIRDAHYQSLHASA